VDRSIRRIGVLGALLAAALIGVLAYGAGELGPASVRAFTTTYDNRVLDDPLELLLVQSDGQAFASLARDPTLARPEVFRTDAEAAYRAQRPLLPYLAWAGSTGRSGWVPPALAVLAAAGTGLAVAGVARLLADRGAPPALALFVPFLPGTYSALTYAGPEPLGLGLVTWGLVAWDRKRIATAVLLFAAAGLCRESLLIVPTALGLQALWHRRVRLAASLLPAAVAYGLWVGFLRLRIGAWPTDAGEGRLSFPFVGLIDSLLRPEEDNTALYVAITLLLGLTALWVGRGDPLRPVIALHLAFATTMGYYVWIGWDFFGRVLLPADALSLVVIAGHVFRSHRVRVQDGDRSTDAPMAEEAPAIVV
jgi:hypothetical protein